MFGDRIVNGLVIKPYAYLSGAYLSGAYLSGADLSGAYLSGAYLTGADLTGAYLTGADLTGADLTGAYLSGAYLRSADLTGANLRSADLTGANLRSANLRSADLTGANLRSADLTGADLTGANLTDAKLPAFQIPQTGPLEVFKRAVEGVVGLRVPAKAGRTASLVGRKCRAEYAKVISVPEGVDVCHGLNTYQFLYRLGETVRPDSYDPDPRVECTHGIHFFLTREEAENYK